MSLPAPNLDDRTFQQIVDDVKQQIGRRCPEWTDHNVSDPGVTLIELFAYMMEMTLYRLNRVPERNYIKFLEMIGLTLLPPTPAQTDLRFLLSRPIEDIPGEEAFERTLRATETVAATMRTETEEAVEFSTDADLRFVRPRLTHIIAAPSGSDPVQLPSARELALPSPPFAIFSAVPQIGDALYMGFDEDISGNLIELEVDCVQSAATGLDEDYPAQEWQVWNGAASRWDALGVERDTTYGFNRPPGAPRNDEPSGLVLLRMPYQMSSRQLGGRRGFWVRCIYNPELDPRGTEGRRPAPYQKPPEIRSVLARTIGGYSPASNCTVVAWRELGHSDGLPGQSFLLGNAPILQRRSWETVLTGSPGTPNSDMLEWTEVDDFAQSREEDRHFACDSITGEILFGPNVAEPDGSTRQYGAVPDKGHTVVFSAFRFGGGTIGNVGADQIQVLKSSVPYVATVTNPVRAAGGREQETLERAKLRGREILRLRDRAVTSEDYEYLALRASGGVGRARCVQPHALHAISSGGTDVLPGMVRVLLIPALGGAVPVPRPADLRVSERVRTDVEAYLDERRLLTAVLDVAEPDYVFMSTEITLVAAPRANPEIVRRAVQSRLETYFHPLSGGPSGTGWPFLVAATLSDVYAQVHAASGVAFLLDVKIFVSRFANKEAGLLTAEQLVPTNEGVPLGESEMLCTREHRIRVRPLWVVGQTEEA